MNILAKNSIFHFYLILVLILLLASCSPRKVTQSNFVPAPATYAFSPSVSFAAISPSSDVPAKGNLYGIESESMRINGGEKRFRNVIKVNGWNRELAGGREKINERKLFLADIMKQSAVEQCYPKKIANPTPIDFGMYPNQSVSNLTFTQYADVSIAPYTAEAYFNCR